MAHTKWFVLALVAVGVWAEPSIGQTLDLVFSGERRFEPAVHEYQEIWRTEGERMTTVLQDVSGLTFDTDSIRVEVMEGPSWAGSSNMGMRASYSAETKRATLAHELGHILIGDLIPEDAAGDTVPEPHYVLFLFLYDAWVELWGMDFADEQVQIESARRGIVDYERIWQTVLNRSAEARSAELRGIVARYTGGRAPRIPPGIGTVLWGL